MKRTHVSWSNSTDKIEGPCVVCGKDVYFLLPSDRSDPALLFHPTCDVMPALREHLKTTPPPPPLPASYLIQKPAKPAPAV